MEPFPFESENFNETIVSLYKEIFKQVYVFFRIRSGKSTKNVSASDTYVQKEDIVKHC